MKKLLTIGLLGLFLAVNGLPSLAADITYGSTAGTGDSNTTGADYAESTGAGASVSATTTLDFNLTPKVAIALHDGTSFTGNPLFAPIAGNISSANFSHSSPSGALIITGALYTNAENVVITFGTPNVIETTLTHTVDPSSQVTLKWQTVDYLNDYFSNRGIGETVTLSASNLVATNGLWDFFVYGPFYDLEATDRSGLYRGSVTITATLP